MNFDREIAKFEKRQQDAVDALDSGVKFLLYGGALGGGKSYFLRWYALRYLLDTFHQGHKNVNVMLCCENYPALKDRQLQKIALEYPPWIGTEYSDHKAYGRCFKLHESFGSGVVCFRNLDDPSKYSSAEFACILVDELTKNDYGTFSFLRTRLRWTGMADQDAKFIGATNPGSVGHSWVKQLWIDRQFPVEFVKPRDYRDLFAYIPSMAIDNPYLDESYWLMLDTLPESMRRAFKDGDWSLFVGQMFKFIPEYHVIDPLPIPEDVPIYMTFDWGFGAPFSIGWWWIDNDGRLYRFKEWYGWNGTPNSGLRLSDSEIAEGILEREATFGLKGRDIRRLAGHDCFQKRPDYKGGGQGASTADIFRSYGIYLQSGDVNRLLKVKQFHNRLRVVEGEVPMLVVYKGCEHFIRTVPSLVQSETNIEDVDSNGEDHVYDEACHIIMARSPEKIRQLGLDPDRMLGDESIVSESSTEEIAL